MSARLLALLLALLASVTVLAAPPGAPETDPAAAPDQTPGEAADRAVPADSPTLEDIRTFTAVYNLVKRAYVDDVDDHRLMQAAIRGLLSDLDPHSEYLDEAQIEDLAEDTTGSYNGLGVEVMQVQGTLRVVAPIDGSPAERAGIRAGDTIVSIDGKAVQPDDLDAAVAMLRGKVGTEVTLGVLHERQGTPVDIVVRREVIRVASARGRLLEPGYAYLRVSQFQADTGNQLRRRIAQLEAANKSPLRGAILDLRSNPGGLLTSAVEVSNLFLDRGVIVTTRGRTPEADMSFSATPGGDALGGAPLVVLIDNGTASAAEIVAGALKDNHRALLMGRRSFGKGSVQTVLPLDADHAVKITTARYYTPSGVSIQAAGIEPDIALADLSLSPRRDVPVLIGERDLRNHLKGSEEDQAPASPRVVDRDLETDYALNEALNALKALVLRGGVRTKG